MTSDSPPPVRQVADETPAAERPAWFYALVLALLATLAFGPAIFSRGPWHVDDLRYSEVARQMDVYGDLLVPHVNGEVYPEKPPGYFWAVIGVHRLTGAGYVESGRIAAALAVLGSALLMMALGRMLLGSARTGALGGAIFATFFFVMDRGQRSLIDSFLLLPTTAASVALLASVRAERWGDRLLLLGGCAVSMAAACVTKGPVGLAVPLLGATACAAAAWGKGLRTLLLGAVPALLGGGATLLWLYLASRQAGDWYLDRLLFHQSAGRAVESFAHQKPFYYYLTILPGMTAPWIILLPAALWRLLRARGRPEFRLALGVFVGALAILLFFSVISGKRSGYILPVLPFLGLATAWGLAGPASKTRTYRWFAVAPVRLLAIVPPLFGALLLVVGLLLPWFRPWADPAGAGGGGSAAVAGLPRFSALVCLGAGFGLAVLSWFSASNLRQGRIDGAMWLCTAAVALSAGGAHLTVFPALDSMNSPEPFARAVERQLHGGETLLTLDADMDGRINYYLGYQRLGVVEREEVESAADRPGTVLIVAMKKEWGKLPEPVRDRFLVAAEHPFSGRELVLARERRSHSNSGP